MLINNAAVLLGEEETVLGAPAEDFRRSMEANVFGPLVVARSLMPGMIERGYGIVNVSSGVGRLTDMADYTPRYSMSKAALSALAGQRSSRADLPGMT